jgi:hypothetical protein
MLWFSLFSEERSGTRGGWRMMLAEKETPCKEGLASESNHGFRL